MFTLVYMSLLAISIAAFVYRDRARQWLDERFFRQEYDARKILVSLASRVRFETDPSDLAAMVVTQIDEALHPEMIAILVSGIEEQRLAPVTVLHGSAESLAIDGGLVAMLRWSDEPLEIFIHDPRSPVRRLPAEEQEWLECTRAVLLVPVVAQDKTLVGVIVLGERQSEEAYTAEDRQLLASIAAQMGLGFDVARLRRQVDSAGDSGGATTYITPRIKPMMECPRCGRCEDPEVRLCPADGASMTSSSNVPRVLDEKYRLEQLLGRGGMGAVYRARDMRLDRLVAVKVVRAELLGDMDARRRFRREAQIVARLQHPAIVAVFDYGTLPDGGAYLVMELVKGEDLRRVLVREGRLEPARAADPVERLRRDRGGPSPGCSSSRPEAREHPAARRRRRSESAGFRRREDHRPRSPRRHDGGRRTVLTVEGAVVGTPAYMAPEQLRGQTPDARTDVFSLGVIAYEMLTGICRSDADHSPT